jgi:hypothetical protein
MIVAGEYGLSALTANLPQVFTIRNNGWPDRRDFLLPRRSQLMGHARRRPGRLAEKLKKIRNTLGLS